MCLDTAYCYSWDFNLNLFSWELGTLISQDRVMMMRVQKPIYTEIAFYIPLNYYFKVFYTFQREARASSLAARTSIPI